MTDQYRHPTTYTSCVADDCPAKVANHYWGHVRADRWFHQKDGRMWCPDHIPEWVEEWRQRKAARP